MGFKEELQNELANLLQDKSPEEESPFVQVLRDAADAITSSSADIVAYVAATGPSSRRYTLTIRPAYQPGRSYPILPIWLLSDGTIRVLFEQHKDINEVPNFKDYIRSFLRMPQVIETMQLVANQNKDVVEAYLRVEADGQPTRNDLLVEVEPLTQKALHEAAEGQTLKTNVRISSFPGAGEYDETLDYKMLDSGGIRFGVSSLHRSDRDIALQLVKSD